MSSPDHVSPKPSRNRERLRARPGLTLPVQVERRKAAFRVAILPAGRVSVRNRRPFQSPCKNGEFEMMLQKYVNRQTDEMRRLPFEEDVPTTCAGDMAVGFLAAAAILAVIIGWLV